jgi:hypothetical protein
VAEATFSRADLISAIDDGKRRRRFFEGRARAFDEAGITKPVKRTEGGLSRYDNDARIRAVIANLLLDWGLQHPQKLPETERANPSRSVFWAMAEALDPMTIDFVINATRRGEDWILRVDRIVGADGEPTFLARAYPCTEARDYGETPDGCASTLGIGLLPLLAHLVGEA